MEEASALHFELWLTLDENCVTPFLAILLSIVAEALFVTTSSRTTVACEQQFSDGEQIYSL